MAGALVGGAFLSGFINVVFDRLSSPEVLSLIRSKKLDEGLLLRLKNTLYAVEAVLNDAELKQIKDSAVNKWLDDLKDAVYVADDILDHVSTKAATQREVSSNFFSRYFNFQEREMVHKLHDIVGRLESILKLKDVLGLKEIPRDNFSWRIPSTSLADGSNIYGRDKDKESLLKLLLDDDTKNSDGKISVIPIVGMGGVGKTTLAQLAFNDDKVKQKFKFQAWACVSEEFDILKVTKMITVAVTKSSCNMNDINLLQLELKEKVTEEKFLIVLDDVWSEDYVKWNFLIKPLQYGAKGSKIVVTTRSEKVARTVQTVQFFRLKELSDEDCWSVFASHACFSLESGENRALEKIGREIARKCKGLPLGAQSLGGLLRGKRDILDWEGILNSNFWEFSDNESKIIPALRISYHYLPPYLKRCFVYCSLYPQDYVFNKQKLVLLWMAEDLLQPPKNGKTSEEVGYGYFDDLASISFFQPHSYWKGLFVMHDLVHDLATLLGREFYFQTEELSKETKAANKTRHLSFKRFSDPVSENFEIFGEVKFLRTFLPTSSSNAEFNNENAPCIILSKFKYLRVLSFLHFPNLDTLPNSIGKLIHLRYLNLSETDIKTLPESLCKLYNLQTLMLQDCRKLAMLPSGMQNLVNLRHFDISGTNLEEMPRGMSKLNHLQHLSHFLVGKHDENGIKELGKLANLHGSLEIMKLENVTSSIVVSEARMMDKKYLNRLRFLWSEGDDFTNSQSEMEILDKLEPHKNLKSLCIEGYRGTKFPEWVGHPSFHNMTNLTLSRCNNCCMLPCLGQLPSLKELVIQGLNGVEIITADFYKRDDSSFSGTPFPALKDLIISDMACWKVWCPFESDAFPKLKWLQIKDCPKLMGDLPTHLPALEVLGIQRCQQLASSSLPRAPAIRELQIVECNKLALQELPLSLKDLEIGGRHDMEPIFKAITQSTTLQFLQIKNCSSATSFPGNCLPTSLKRLSIKKFRKLQFPKQNQHQLLESLVIVSSCDSLKSFPLESFPNLSDIRFSNFENLERLSVSDLPLQNLSCLFVSACPSFVSFPRGGLSAPRLTEFTVSKCHKLKSLPCHMNTLLPKLQYLTIEECPEIESFPEGGMPLSLRSLDISNCDKLLRSPSPSLGSMDMLTDLYIGGPCDGVKSFPEEGLVLLPPSLTSLELYKLSSVETLECKGLLHLTSLQKLEIRECPKLENVAGERLPVSLIKLKIYECPLLEERCNRKHPQVWPKISHIRGIMVNKRWISST